MLALKPYPEYKDTVHTLLGRTPRHWRSARIKNFLRESDRRSGTGDGVLLSLTRTRGLIPQQSATSKPPSAADLSSYKVCKPGQLVMNRMQAWSGMFAAAQIDGLVSPDYSVFNCTSGSVDYLQDLFRSPLYVCQCAAASKGVGSGFNRLYTPDFGAIPVEAPPVKEQMQIASFVRRFSRGVERLIRAKRRVIELLNEQKQAIILRAVTRGLDPNIPLKPSGVDWLGDIPEHWVSVKLGALVTIQTGYPFQSSGFSNDSEDVRLLRGINVSVGKIRWDSVVRWPTRLFDEVRQFSLQPGDLVLGMDRPIVRSGVRVATIQEDDTPSLLLQRVARIHPTDKINHSFLANILCGKLFSDYLVPIFTGISVPHISPEQIASFRLSLPPIEEQKAISSWIDQNVSLLNNQIALVAKEIDLLREYRTRLIADVVTGKLDVRGVKLQEVKDDDSVESPAESDDEDLAEADNAPEDETVEA